ncbi:MAG: hypothetical protein R3B90_16290 [Planctomycetaceae bacterium]
MPELIVEPVWSWPLLLMASAALIGVVLLTYPSRVRHLPPFWRRLLLGLRLASAIVLIFALLRPAVRYSEIDQQAAQLVVLLDSSRSMGIKDGTGGLTRREALLKTLSDAGPELKELAERVDLRFIDFAEDLSPVDDPTAATEGRQTAIGTALDELRREDTGKRLVGILLLSDGAQRTLGREEIAPLTAARRLAEQRGVPIYTVTYGTAELSSAGLDLAVEDIVVDPLAYEKKTVPVRLQLRTAGAAGRKVKVRLLIEETAGLPGNEQSTWRELPVAANARPFEEIEIRGNNTLQARELSFVAERAGEFKLAVEVVPEDGELKMTNNRYETVITVLKGGLKVAYFDVTRSVEQKFIRRLNENARIQLDVFLVPGGPFLQQARLDPALFQRGAYDVYVIGDLPAFVFRQGGTDLLAELLARCREGAGLAMLGGARNYGPGGYADTPIAALLPVKMSPAERVEINAEPPAEAFLAGPFQMLPGPDGRAHYLMQIGPNSDALWRQLPELKNGANRLVPATATVNVLAITPARDPLLLGWETASSRVLAVGVSDTWRWYTHGFAATHQRFWEQALLWLARMENESDQPVWARLSPRNYAPGDKVSIVTGAQDDQLQPIAGANFQVEVTGPEGMMTRLSALSSGDEATAEFTATTQPGDYQVVVTATKGDQSLGPPARTRFIVDARDPELDNPAADPDLMAEIATISGAVPVPAEQFDEFVQELIDAGLAADVTRYTQINLWDGWPLLLVFVLLLTTEWVVRKWRGLV